MIDTLLIFLLQIAVILVATRAGSLAAIKLGIAPILGELVAGIALGPTLFGLLLPEAQSFIFPGVNSPNYEILQSMSWMGLIFLMFIGGLEVDMSTVRTNFGRASLIAVCALVFSLGIGMTLASMLPHDVFPTPNHQAFDFFFAIALAITAIPVLIKILIDLNLLKTRFGAIIVVAGVIVDTVGWILLAIVIRGATQGFYITETLITCALIAAFLIATFTLGRFVFKRLVGLQGKEDDLSINFLAAVMALMLLGAAITHYLGIHPVLGAFAVGLMVGMWHLSSRIKEKIQDFAFSFFVPIFIASLGLRANLLLIDSWQLWGLTLFIIVIISLAKLFGGALGARLGGLGWAEAGATGIAANAQGAMGLVAATVGYDLGLIPSNLYAILVVVAVIRTLLSAFGLQSLKSRIKSASV